MQWHEWCFSHTTTPKSFWMYWTHIRSICVCILYMMCNTVAIKWKSWRKIAAWNSSCSMFLVYCCFFSGGLCWGVVSSGTWGNQPFWHQLHWLSAMWWLWCCHTGSHRPQWGRFPSTKRTCGKCWKCKSVTQYHDENYIKNFKVSYTLHASLAWIKLSALCIHRVGCNVAWFTYRGELWSLTNDRWHHCRQVIIFIAQHLLQESQINKEGC